MTIRPQQNSNVVGEDFRSLLTNSREHSEITIETTRIISGEVCSQASRRQNEIKDSLHFQTHNAITTTIAEKVLPSIQKTLDTHGRANFTVADQGSNGLHKSSRAAKFTVADQGSNGLHKSSRAAKFTMADQSSSGLQRNREAGIGQQTRENRPKTCFAQENRRQMSRESSVDSYVGEQNRDRK